MHVSKSTISGPSGSAGSIHNAVRGLAEFIVLVMNDEANLDGLKESLLDTDNSFQNGSKSSQLVLEVFRSFPLNSQIQGTNLFEKNSNTACEFPIKLEAQKNNSCQSTGSFHVNRTKEWIVATSFRVDKLLSLTFPNVLFVNLLYLQFCPFLVYWFYFLFAFFSISFLTMAIFSP